MRDIARFLRFEYLAFAVLFPEEFQPCVGS